MNYFEDAKQLVEHSIAQLPSLKNELDIYKVSGGISTKFKILTKEILGNLHSSLDYCACGIYQAVNGDLGKARPHFPIANLDDDLRSFSQKLKSAIPNVEDKLPMVASYIIGCQSFSEAQGNWLTDLKNLTNDNKHTAMTANDGYSGVDLIIRGRDGQSVFTATSITLGEEAKIKGYGDLIIRGPQKIVPGKPVIFEGNGEVYAQLRREIFFTQPKSKIVVMPFVENVSQAVEKTVKDISIMSKLNG